MVPSKKTSKRSICFYIGSITACPSSGWGRLAQSRVERNGLTGIRASEGVQTALPTHTLGVLLHLQSGVLLHLLIGAPFADRRLSPVADRILNPFVARARAFWFARFCQ